MDFGIDEHNLHKECVRHPKMVRIVAEELAAAKRDLAIAQRDLTVIQTEVDRAVREKPEKYGLNEKPAETAIKAVVARSKRVDDAERGIIEIEYRVNMIVGANRTLDHRKRNLTDLVNLHGQNYYSEIRGSSEGREEVDRRAAKNRHGVKQKRRAEEEDDEADED